MAPKTDRKPSMEHIGEDYFIRLQQKMDGAGQQFVSPWDELCHLLSSTGGKSSDVR